MRLSSYVCTSCGSPSTRKWNMRRHISLMHSGIGSFVTLMDYLSGRQAGAYPELINSELKRTSSENWFDMWWKEFIREDAKQKAYRANSPTYPVWGQNAQYVSQYPGLHKPHAQATHPDPNEIIGYSGRVCSDCFKIELFTLTNTCKSLTIHHACKPEALGKALLLNETEKSIKLQEGRMQIPFDIRSIMLHDWTSSRIFLHAQQTSSGRRIDESKLTPVNQYHWAARSIKSGCTQLNNEELTDS
jgi:hypothetical protein